jgi:hypothetical protein
MDCPNLKDITFPDSLQSVGGHAFYETQWLAANRDESSLVVANGILIDGSLAAGDVLLPSNVKSISDGAFSGNKSIASVSASEGLKAIGEKAFKGCSNLYAASLPKSVSSVGIGAFSKTPWLKSLVSTPDKLAVINNVLIAVGDVESLQHYEDRIEAEIVNVPAGVAAINRDALKNLSSEWIIIPEGVKSLHHLVFSRLICDPCIVLPDSLSEIEGGDFEFKYWATLFISAKSPLFDFFTLGSHSYKIVSVEDFKAADGKTLFETLKDAENSKRWL